jgi:hypothetical protein
LVPDRWVELFPETIRVLRLAALSLTACMAPVGTSGVISVPPAAAQTCAQHCQTIGMRLTAVAIMANNVGCLCQSPAPAGSAAGSSSRAAPGSAERRSFGVNEGATESATTTAGMATILMEQERQRQQVPPPLTRY